MDGSSCSLCYTSAGPCPSSGLWRKLTLEFYANSATCASLTELTVIRLSIYQCRTQAPDIPSLPPIRTPRPQRCMRAALAASHSHQLLTRPSLGRHLPRRYRVCPVSVMALFTRFGFSSLRTIPCARPTDILTIRLDPAGRVVYSAVFCSTPKVAAYETW